MSVKGIYPKFSDASENRRAVFVRSTNLIPPSAAAPSPTSAVHRQCSDPAVSHFAESCSSSLLFKSLRQSGEPLNPGLLVQLFFFFSNLIRFCEMDAAVTNLADNECCVL